MLAALQSFFPGNDEEMAVILNVHWRDVWGVVVCALSGIWQVKGGCGGRAGGGLRRGGWGVAAKGIAG